MKRDLWRDRNPSITSTSGQVRQDEPAKVSSEDGNDESPAASYHSSQEEISTPQTAKPPFSTSSPPLTSATPTPDPTSSLTLKLQNLSLAPNPSTPTSHAHAYPDSDLESIDLRSPSDDPDYDFIEASEAVHSARNAQPDRKGKYPQLQAEADALSAAQRELAERAESENPDYDFLEKSEAMNSARNAHRDRRWHYPGLEGEGKQVERGGGQGRKKKKKGWFC